MNGFGHTGSRYAARCIRTIANYRAVTATRCCPLRGQKVAHPEQRLACWGHCRLDSMNEHDTNTMRTSPADIRIADRVSQALGEGAPVVALESTVIAHGLPYPTNLETALACEAAARRLGATPATIGIIDGEPTIGLNEEEIELFASRHAPDGRSIEKVGLNNLAGVIALGAWGATTVAASLQISHVAGIRVFSTGGVGGVHRRA